MSVGSIRNAGHFSTSIYEAARLGNVSKIEDFINQGGHIETPNKEGHSMLYYAYRNGQVSVIRYLLQNGAHLYDIRADIEKASELFSNIVIKTENFAKKEVSSYKPLEETLRSINAIVDQIDRNQALKNYARELAFGTENALDILQYVEAEDKMVVEKELVHSFLAYGAIELAQSVLDQVTDPGTAQFIALQINLFSQMFDAMETNIEEEPLHFSGLITQGLYHHLFLDDCVEIDPTVLKMAECRSLKEALEYANSLSPELSCFAKHGLSHCGLEALVKNASDFAQQAVELGFQS